MKIGRDGEPERTLMVMKTLKTKKFLEQSRMTEKHNQEMRAFYADASRSYVLFGCLVLIAFLVYMMLG